VQYRDLSPAPRTFRRPAASAVSVGRARHFNADPGPQWRPEREVAQPSRAPVSEHDVARPSRAPVSEHGVARPPRAPISEREVVRPSRAPVSEREVVRPSRAPVSEREVVRPSRAPISEREVARPPRAPISERAAIQADRNRARFEQQRRQPQPNGLERSVLLVSAGLLVGAAGCFWLLYGVFGAPISVSSSPQAMFQGPSTTGYAPVEVMRSGKSDSLARSTHPMIIHAADGDAFGAIERIASAPAPDAARAAKSARVAAQSPSYFKPAPVKVAENDWTKDTKSQQPLMRLAALENPAPVARPRTAIEPVIPRIPADGDAKTALVDFQTAPFPYDGKMPGSNRPFLDAGQPGHRGHTNFRGRVLWESETFSDPRVLLSIPPGFDANRPSVMVVYFHGHGANLSTDVRDRQKLPAQITASGINAVLVAPQFAVDAADSSAGKFWEPDGFKRFVDEAAKQLAELHGDPRTAQTFARMPIVIVSYSGGFGPTLAVLDHGGVKSRLRGIVLLDSLYSGIDKFANWISENRSGFFVSSYTPHTRGHNADLESILRAKSVSYGSELRHDHLAGSVTFLPAGPISHRDFVTHAWADLPVKDILVRLDEYDPNIQTAKAAPSASPIAAMAPPSRNQ
jgi:hypothetical protein